MIGRQHTLEAIMDGRGQVLTGHGHCHGISGPSGVGKSYLLKGWRGPSKISGSRSFAVAGTPALGLGRCSPYFFHR